MLLPSFSNAQFGLLFLRLHEARRRKPWLIFDVRHKDTPVRIWRQSVTSEQADEKVRSASRRAFFATFALGALAVWTYVVHAIHDYGYAMSAWSDGASRRAPDGWTPYIVLWFISVLIAALLVLMARASAAKKGRRT